MPDVSTHVHQPRILFSKDLESWAPLASEVILQVVSESISSRGICHIMLTGGNTAERLYRYWAGSGVLPLNRIRFLFGDERCVPPDHVDSNYALVMHTLLSRGTPSGCTISRMEADNPDREEAAKAYEKLLPEAIDVLLLGLGTDGHIASLFPHSFALRSGQRSVVPVVGPKPPYERLTITPAVIARARSIFILATGEAKGRILAEALKSPTNYVSLPVCLTMAGTWLLDAEANNQLLNQSGFKKDQKD